MCIRDRYMGTLGISLDGIETLLKKSRTFTDVSVCPSIVSRLEKIGGVDKIEKLQYHSNSRIYETASKIIEEFFGAEEVSIEPTSMDSVSIFNYQYLSLIHI
eukprot:TRINITY_DN24195_c0_g1_i3.p4 TRINITY_DN24195_c0_g1~~TRINITY_DN24195_c0_g1_i3.p4  ORF type:complete len:102 (+),score=19.36 TRINITY_DN24195_c0_g1_i3:172-477(+)